MAGPTGRSLGLKNRWLRPTPFARRRCSLLRLRAALRRLSVAAHIAYDLCLVDTPRPSRRGPILLGVVHPLLCLNSCSDNGKGGKVALALMRVPQNAHEDKDEVYDSLTLR